MTGLRAYPLFLCALLFVAAVLADDDNLNFTLNPELDADVGTETGRWDENV